MTTTTTTTLGIARRLSWWALLLVVLVLQLDDSATTHAWLLVDTLGIPTNRRRPFGGGGTTTSTAPIPRIPTYHFLSSADDDNDDDKDAASAAVSSSLPSDYQAVGTQIIRQACATAAEGAPLQVDVEWKAGHIVVTLRAENLYLSSPVDDAEENDDEEDYNDDDNGESEDMLFLLEDEDETISAANAVDVTTVARAINAALDSSAVGQAIAERYSIEVTTPGASDELQGDRMFRAYQGFDVICVYKDPKKQDKEKTIQGRLVERNEQHVVVNVKGRMSKLIRENVVSVKLPKAKKEN